MFWAPVATPLDWEDFIRLCPADAAEFARNASEIGQDAYLNRIAAWAVRLKAAPDTKPGAFAPKPDPGCAGLFYIRRWRPVFRNNHFRVGDRPV